MEPTIQELSRLLAGMIGIYRQLLLLSQQKQQELVKGSIDELAALVRQEEQLILRLSRLEEERYRCAEGLVALLGLPEGVTLGEILAAVPGEERQVLEGQQDELVRLLDQMAALNRENVGLINQALRFVNSTMDALTQDPRTTYQADKEMKTGGTSKIVDKTV